MYKDIYVCIYIYICGAAAELQALVRARADAEHLHVGPRPAVQPVIHRIMNSNINMI